MLKALHTVVFHFLVRPRHLDISAMWRLWISVCCECQSIAFISEIPFVRPVGMLLWFHAGYERASKWQTIDSWILMEKWPSWGRMHHRIYHHDTFPIGKLDSHLCASVKVSVCVRNCVCVQPMCGPLIKICVCMWQRSVGSVGQHWVALSLTLKVLIMDD